MKAILSILIGLVIFGALGYFAMMKYAELAPNIQEQQNAAREAADKAKAERDAALKALDEALGR